MGLVSANNLRPDVARHGPFYSLCQAVFYVVIFRHKQILESDNGMDQYSYCTVRLDITTVEPLIMDTRTPRLLQVTLFLSHFDT